MNICCKCRETLIDAKGLYGLHENCFMEWFGLSILDEFSEIIPRSQSQVPMENLEKNTTFFHGAFRKYSSRLGKDTYILKVIQLQYPELQATEFLCNQIYENLGIKIPNYYLIRFPEDHFCFVTKNFMSRLLNSSLVHIYHYLKTRDDHNCEKLVTVIGENTGRRTEQERFVYLTLADSLIGNHDRHGRNLGFIQSPKGMCLAPFYDNPSYIGLEDDLMLGADLQPSGAISTKETNEPKMRDYVFEWNRLGYGNVVQRFQKKFSFHSIKQLVESSWISQKRQNALIRLITKRGNELCDNIK